ncbi:MAG: hypothetical protein HKO98_14185 [Gemmatimonadetes bacterium]|nr:hypothetical protein [Gemmatimonadota bacterium]
MSLSSSFVRITGLVLVVVLAACSSDDDAPSDTSAPQPEAAPARFVDIESATFVVTSPVAGDAELFLVEGRADTAWTRLTFSSGLDNGAEWIPGRRSVIFHSARDGEAATDLDLYLLDVTADFADEETRHMRNADAVRLTDAPGADYLPAIDPEGARVAFVSRRAEGVEVAATSGHVYRLLITQPYSGGPAASPGEPEGGAGSLPLATRITETPINASLPPAWSPDGRALFFVRRTEEGTELRVIPAAGSSPGSGERLILADVNFNYTPLPSPDGEWLAYTAEGDDAARVVLMRPDGTESRALTQSGRVYVDQWLPDGSTLIVTSWDQEAERTDAMLLSVEDGTLERLFTGVARPSTGVAVRIR